MPKTTTETIKSFEFRRIISKPFHLKIITTLSEEWGITKQECLWILLNKAIKKEAESIKKSV